MPVSASITEIASLIVCGGCARRCRFNGLTLFTEQALGAIKVELFQRFHTPGLI
jgi:hypothetical protein